MNVGVNYLDYWKLELPPFESQADPEFFYESKTHSEALTRMLYFVGDKGMGIGVLTGQPELKEQLKALPQVYQWVGMYYHLTHLTADETADYIAHRISAAGAPDPMRFDEECAGMIHSFSRGFPRQINRVCKLVVDRACLMRKEMVDKQDVCMIIDDIVNRFGVVS